MKKSLVALAVFGAFSGLAQADNTSVTLYGIIDAGIMSASKTAGGANGQNEGGRVLGFQDAQLLPSIYGIKGTEDLGGGLKAGFNLEGGFDTHNGTHNSPGVIQTNIFGREAKVTLGGDWGTVGGGLQVDPALIAAIATEPRGMTDSLSSLEYWIIATAGTTPQTLTGGIFDTNAVTYTYSGNGLYLGLLYSFGGVAGSTSSNSGYSLGASYANSGLVVSAGYAESKANIAAAGTAPAYNGTQDKIDFIGVGYTFGPFAGRLQYQNFKSAYSLTGVAGSDIKDIGLGLDWSMGANKLNLSLYRAKDSGPAPAIVLNTGGSAPANLGVVPGGGGKTTEIALLDTYNLSKRTSVYGQIASVKSDAITSTGGPGLSATLGGIYTVAGLTNATDTSTLFIGIGVQHTF